MVAGGPSQLLRTGQRRFAVKQTALSTNLRIVSLGTVQAVIPLRERLGADTEATCRHAWRKSTPGGVAPRNPGP
jgi:hypothetical protein